NIYVADTNNDRIQRITQCGVQHLPVVLAESVGLQDVVTSFSGTGVGKNLSVVLAESVGLQDVVTSFSGTGGGKNVSVVLEESVGLQDEVTTQRVILPTAPQNLEAVPGDAQVSLSWQAPSSNGGSPITNYKIYRSLSSGV